MGTAGDGCAGLRDLHRPTTERTPTVGYTRCSPPEVGIRMFFDPIYIAFVLLPTLALTGWAAWRVRSTYAKWSKVDSGINLDPFDFARRLLDRRGLTHVRIEPVPGDLTDHYDPRGKILRVSAAVAGRPDAGHFDPTTGAVGVSSGGTRLSRRCRRGDRARGRPRAPGPCRRPGHEAAAGDRAGRADRLWDRPVACHRRRDLHDSRARGRRPHRLAGAVLFTFATLPVEIGASGKALAFVDSLGMQGERQTGARDVLKAAAWTYVAGALTALLTFLYYAWLVFGRRD